LFDKTTLNSQLSTFYFQLSMRLLVLAILLLLWSLAFGFGLLAYAMYCLLGVILVGRYLADRWSSALVARREISHREVKLGESVAVVVTIENRHWLPIPWLLLEDLLPRRALIHDPPNLRVSGRRLQLVSLRPAHKGKQDTKTIYYQLTCNRRGYYQIGPLVAETGDLFGLYRRFRILSAPSFLLAYPKVIPLDGYDIASRRPIGEVRMSHRLYEDPTRIAGLREYRAGDPQNRIHWGATARTGQLHSKVYEPSSIAGATLLVDFHQQSFESRHEPFRSELAITASASIAGALVEMGQQVGLVTNGRDAADRIRTQGWSHEQLHSRQAARTSPAMHDSSERLQPVIVPTGRTYAGWMQILETLARLELTDGLTCAQLIEETTSRLPRSATILAILTAVTPQTAIALGNLHRRGHAVSAILNVYEPTRFAEMSGPLIAQHIPTRQLVDESAVPSLLSECVMR
jgi:uncharacterized protein (DUF58 family)